MFFTASYLDGFLAFSTQGFLILGNLTAVMFVFLHSVVFGRLSLLRYKVNKAQSFGSFMPFYLLSWSVLVLFVFSITYITTIPVNLCILITGFESTWRRLQRTTNIRPNFTPNSTFKFSLEIALKKS